MRYETSKNALLALHNPARNIRLIPVSKAETVCAIVYLKGQHDAESIQLLYDYADKFGFKLHMLIINKGTSFIPKCCLKDNVTIIDYGIDYNSKEILNFGPIEEFINIDADILFSVSDDMEYVVEAIAARSTSHLKVGKYHMTYKNSDINIKVNILSKAPLIKTFVSSLDKIAGD